MGSFPMLNLYIQLKVFNADHSPSKIAKWLILFSVYNLLDSLTPPPDIIRDIVLPLVVRENMSFEQQKFKSSMAGTQKLWFT